MRKLLIITSQFTGHGHKSIADALAERLSVYDDLKIKVVNGFSLMNRFEQYMAEYTYGPITRMPGKAWEWNFAVGQTFHRPVNTVVASMIKSRLLALLERFQPDAILSVHPIFLGSVLDVMQEADLDIPLIAHEVDLVDITDYWFDPRIYRLLAPSKEAYEYSVARAADPRRVIQVGFPVRKRFIDVPAPAPHEGTVVTIMSGSEGSGMIRNVTKVLLKHTDVRVNVVCGRNKKLRKRLKKTFGEKHRGRLSILGFVEDIQNIMAASDVLILRASPNAAMEAIALNVPVIIFGHLAGQEEHNPDMLKAHGVAKNCPNLEDLPDCVRALFDNECAQIRAMREAQRAYAPSDAAAGTARLLHDILTEREMP